MTLWRENIVYFVFFVLSYLLQQLIHLLRASCTSLKEPLGQDRFHISSCLPYCCLFLKSSSCVYSSYFPVGVLADPDIDCLTSIQVPT